MTVRLLTVSFVSLAMLAEQTLVSLQTHVHSKISRPAGFLGRPKSEHFDFFMLWYIQSIKRNENEKSNEIRL